MPQHPSAKPNYFWHGQFAHAVGLALLLGVTWLAVDFRDSKNQTVAGIDVRVWFIIALLVPIAHQIFVWLAWRSEICFAGPSRVFGTHAFQIYQIIFFALFLARPITLIMLAIADHDSLDLSIPLRCLVCTGLGLPALYTGYSVVRYFGISRAAGADHFDASYRDVPLVRKGIFRWTPNAMYVFGFFIVWVPAFLFQSVAALAVAAFSHLYIWVHYYCTEKPDMRHIYG